MMLLVQCPKCKQRMNYQGRSEFLSGKRKVCVYCGKSFSVREQIIRKGKKVN